MYLKLDIPPALEQRLRTFASEHDLSIEQVGEQALSVGLATLSGAASDIILQPSVSYTDNSTPASAIKMPSPLKTNGLARNLTFTVEPAVDPNDHAY